MGLRCTAAYIYTGATQYKKICSCTGVELDELVNKITPINNTRDGRDGRKLRKKDDLLLLLL
jgi:hypothetical protein